MKRLYTVSKNKTGRWLGSDHEVLIAKFRQIEESGGNHQTIQVRPKSSPLWLYSESDK